MLHAQGAWAVAAAGVGRLGRGGRALVRWICGVKAGGGVGSGSLLSVLSVQGLDGVLRAGGVRWFGHVGHG